MSYIIQHFNKRRVWSWTVTFTIRSYLYIQLTLTLTICADKCNIIIWQVSNHKLMQERSEKEDFKILWIILSTFWLVICQSLTFQSLFRFDYENIWNSIMTTLIFKTLKLFVIINNFIDVSFLSDELFRRFLLK